MDQLVEASRQFAQAASSMKGTLERVDRALQALGQLNQSEWAQGLMKAAVTFRDQVDRSGQALSAASGEIRRNLQGVSSFASELQGTVGALSGAAGTLHGASQDLAGAAGETTQVLQVLQLSQQKLVDAHAGVQQLSGNIGSLSTAMATLNGSLTGWSSSQQQQMKHLSDIVLELRDAITPTLKEWQGASRYIRDNAEVAQRALDSVREQFTASNRRLSEILEQQQTTFGDVGARVEASLREGHQRFLAEVNGRFDQGEGLYERLDGLKGCLIDGSKAVSVLDGHLDRLQPAVSAYTDSLSNTRTGIEALQRAVDQLSVAVREQAEQVNSRDAAWARQLELQREAQQQQSVQATQALGRILDQHLEKLPEVIAKWSEPVAQPLWFRRLAAPMLTGACVAAVTISLATLGTWMAVVHSTRIAAKTRAAVPRPAAAAPALADKQKNSAPTPRQQRGFSGQPYVKTAPGGVGKGVAASLPLRFRAAAHAEDASLSGRVPP